MTLHAGFCTRHGLCRISTSLFLKSQSTFSRTSTFKYDDLEVEVCPTEKRSLKPDPSKLEFGKFMTDHMFEVDWHFSRGWGTPKITPLHHLAIHPAAKVLQYACELFEGMKAFKCVDEKIRMFRPEMNMRRMLATAQRTGLPAFDGEELIKCIKKLVDIDREWVPTNENCALYIRPTLIGNDPCLGVAMSRQALLYVILCPVGPYFATGVKPVSLLADPKYVRAWPGGCGDQKMGSNYAPTVAIQNQAETRSFQQVLWLYGEDHQLTEVGTMNIFVYLINENGEKELVTPPLNGLILPGVTRYSLLDIANSWKDFKTSERTITMPEILKALDEYRLLEVFGAGTAATICPVQCINYKGKDYHIPTMKHENPLALQFLKILKDIQYGRVRHPWAVDINS